MATTLYAYMHVSVSIRRSPGMLMVWLARDIAAGEELLMDYGPMYFKHENGSYKRVPIYPNAQLGTLGRDANDIKGGMTVYYTQKDFSGNGNKKITAFPAVCSLPLSISPVVIGLTNLARASA